MSSHSPIDPEDYMEPRCLLCDEPYGKEPEVRSVPQQRIIQKVDEYMSRRDYAGVERHLLYWLEEARLGHDERGELLVENELIGHYRKVLDRDKAQIHIRNALALLDRLGFEGSISSGTTYTNCATATHAFGDYEKALSLFEKAKIVYESVPRTDPSLLGGLYNNMALTESALGHYDRSSELYAQAIRTMEHVPGGELEQAITYLNMADTAEARYGAEAAEAQIYGWLDVAESKLLESKAPKDGYYAFVCEKCAPSFEKYGYFQTAKELNRRASEIYARD